MKVLYLKMKNYKNYDKLTSLLFLSDEKAENVWDCLTWLPDNTINTFINLFNQANNLNLFD